jgi:HlyD family secretion protein
MTFSSDADGPIHELLKPQKSESRRKRYFLWIGLAVLVLAASVGWMLLDSRSRSSVEYKTMKTRKGSLTVTVTATGELKPVNQVDVGIEVSGTIKSVEVDYNDRVVSGQVLATLDTAKLRAQVLQSEAALTSSEAALLQARAGVFEADANLMRFRHARELSKGKAPSLYEMDSAEAALKRALAQEASAKAQIAQSRAALDAYRSDLDKGVIRAPISGIILTRSVEPGQTVAASLQTPVLFTLAEDLTVMELHVGVDEADVGDVREGQMATFTVDAYPDRSFPAKITQVRYASKTENNVVTYETLMSVDNKDLLLRPGMTATADIMVKEVADALLLPNAALRFAPPAAEKKIAPSRGIVGSLFPRPPHANEEPPAPKGNANRVWITEKGILKPIHVTIGATDGTWTEVISGEITPGMNLVVDQAAAQ